MNLPYLGDHQRRALHQEFYPWIASQTQGTLVNGFAEMRDRGDARVGKLHGAGFTEAHDCRFLSQR